LTKGKLLEVVANFGANDVPISQMSRIVEIDIREMLGETDLPPALHPKNNIIP